MKDVTLKPADLEGTARTIGNAYSDAESTVLEAFALKDEPAAVKEFAAKLGITDTDKISLRGVQTIAQQRFESAGQVTMLFSSLLEKMNQLKERLINNIGR